MNAKTCMMSVATAGVLLLAAPGGAHEGHNHAAPLDAHSAPVRDAAAAASEARSGKYSVSLRVYESPDVTLMDADAGAVRFKNVFSGDYPVIMKFVAAFCAADCAEPDGAFSDLAHMLGKQADKLRMISVSTEPQTAAQMKAYAKRYGRSTNLRFYTGSAEDLAAVQKAFDSYAEGSTRSEPVVFLRPAPGKPWVRIEGRATAGELAKEYRHALASK